MMRSYRSYQNKRTRIAGKTIIGIDPGKIKHQAVIVDKTGIPVEKTFSFSVCHRLLFKSKIQIKTLKLYTSLTISFKQELYDRQAA